MNENVLLEFFRNDIGIDINSLSGSINVLDGTNIDEILPFIGCFVLKNENNIIKNYRLYVPKINDIKTLLINVHEFTHAAQIEKKIGFSDYDDKYEEVFSIAMERIFLNKYFPQYINNFNVEQLNRLKKYVSDYNFFYKYIYAFYYQFILNDLYIDNTKEMFNYKFYNNDNLDIMVHKIKKLLKES